MHASNEASQTVSAVILGQETVVQTPDRLTKIPKGPTGSRQCVYKYRSVLQNGKDQSKTSQIGVHSTTLRLREALSDAVPDVWLDAFDYNHEWYLA